MELNCYKEPEKKKEITTKDVLAEVKVKKRNDYWSAVYKNQVIFKLGEETSESDVKAYLKEHDEILKDFVKKLKDINKKRIESIKEKNEKKKEMRIKLEEDVMKDNILESIKNKGKKKK